MTDLSLWMVMKQQIVSAGPYLINDQMQLLVAILCADKDFWKSEFGFWIFKVSRSCQKPGKGWVVVVGGRFGLTGSSSGYGLFPVFSVIMNIIYQDNLGFV